MVSEKQFSEAGFDFLFQFFFFSQKPRARHSLFIWQKLLLVPFYKIIFFSGYVLFPSLPFQERERVLLDILVPVLVSIIFAKIDGSSLSICMPGILLEGSAFGDS